MWYYMVMKYRELKIETEKSSLEALEALLTENGFISMMIDDPEDVRDIIGHPDVYRYDYINEDLKEDLERNPVITLFFTDDEEGAAGLAGARKLLDDTKQLMELSYSEEYAGDDGEWLYKWQEYFKPVRVGEKIVIRPSWEEYEQQPGDLVIEMDPGMAFGSGLHETTSMCIRALESILGRGDNRSETSGGAAGNNAADRNLRVLDVGTGTGILAIAGVLLGAGEALGIDIDPDAVRVANENIEKNGLADRITAQYGDLTEGIDYRADIVVANLMADLVIRLSPAAAEHLDPGGWYVTSGILDVKEEIVSEAVRKAGFAVEEVLRDGEWCAVIARKR